MHFSFVNFYLFAINSHNFDEIFCNFYWTRFNSIQNARPTTKKLALNKFFLYHKRRRRQRRKKKKTHTQLLANSLATTPHHTKPANQSHIQPGLRFNAQFYNMFDRSTNQNNMLKKYFFPFLISLVYYH